MDDLVGRRRDATVLISGKLTDINASPNIDVRVAVKDIELDDEVRDALPQKAAGLERRSPSAARPTSWSTSSKVSGRARRHKLRRRPPGRARHLRQGPLRPHDGTGQVVFRDDEFSVPGPCPSGTADARDRRSGTVQHKDRRARRSLSRPRAPARRATSSRRWAESVSTHFDRLGLSGFADAEVSVERSSDGKITFSPVAPRPQRRRSSPSRRCRSAWATRSAEVTYSREKHRHHRTPRAALPRQCVAPLAVHEARRRRHEAPLGRQVSGRIGFSGKVAAWDMRFQGGAGLIGDAVPRQPAGVVRARYSGREGCAGSPTSAETLSYGPGEAGAQVNYDFKAHPREIVDVARPGAFRRHAAAIMDIAARGRGRQQASGASGDLSSACLRRHPHGETCTSPSSKTPGEARLQEFSAKMLGGTINGQGRIGLGGNRGYGFALDLRDVSLERPPQQGLRLLQGRPHRQRQRPPRHLDHRRRRKTSSAPPRPISATARSGRCPSYSPL